MALLPEEPANTPLLSSDDDYLFPPLNAEAEKEQVRVNLAVSHQILLTFLPEGDTTICSGNNRLDSILKAFMLASKKMRAALKEKRIVQGDVATSIWFMEAAIKLNEARHYISQALGIPFVVQAKKSLTEEGEKKE